MISKFLSPANLKRLAVRFAKKITIVPHHQLEQLGSERTGTRWQTQGCDPQFLLYPAKSVFGRRFNRGWYMLRIKMTEENHESQLGRIYIHYKNGELEVKDVPWSSQKFVNRIFYLKQAVSHIRFDPCESETRFELNTCLLIKVPAHLAKRSLTERIVKLHSEVESGSAKEISAVMDSRFEAKVSKKLALAALYDETFSATHTEKSYAAWRRLDEKKLLEKARRGAKTSGQTGFSVVLPTYNTDPDLLSECLQSVVRQTYSNWELCIADDASTSQATLEVLHDFQRQYPDKVKLQCLQTNGHISKSSNAALALAEKDFVLLLDHDDMLADYTLELFAAAIHENQEVALVYADEDKIDETGQRHQPHFKPDWNRDLLLSQNYICHPVAVKRKLLEQIGGFREGVEGSQDHDLLLRATAHLTADNIVHLPYILYHWRVIENSTAADASAKSYTSEAGLQAVSDYLNSNHAGATAELGRYPNTYKVCWPIPEPAPLVSLIIPTRDGYDILKQCLDSIYRLTTYKHYEVLVVDNQTTCADTLALFESYQQQYSNFTLLKWDQPFNYSAINNFAVSHAQGEVIGLVNNDIEVITPEWLTEMVSHAIRPDIGCVGAKLFYANDTIQHAGVILGIGGVAGHSHKYFAKHEPGYFTRLHLVQNVSAVTAACLLVRKSVYQQVKGLNEQDLTVAFNDVDFCLKVLNAGYQNLFTPWAELYHHESISRGEEDSPEKIKRFNGEADFMRKSWAELLDNDPAYNPNLSLTHENFSLR